MAAGNRSSGCWERAPSLFSYPYGGPDALSMRHHGVGRKAGYTMACTATGGIARPDCDPLRIPRNVVGDWDAERFERWLDRWQSGAVGRGFLKAHGSGHGCHPNAEPARPPRLTLTSVLRQRDVDLHVIVVDDASTDDTAGVVARFGDSRAQSLAPRRCRRASAPHEMPGGRSDH